MSLHKNHEKDKFLYEQRPYIYIVLALVCFALGKYTKIATVSGVILALCGAYTYHMRKTYRDTNERIDQLNGKSGRKK